MTQTTHDVLRDALEAVQEAKTFLANSEMELTGTPVEIAEMWEGVYGAASRLEEAVTALLEGARQASLAAEQAADDAEEPAG